MTKPSRHSYSSLSKYNRCPRQWKYSYIDGLPDPSGKAAMRGSRLHLSGERYLQGLIKNLVVDFWKVQKNMEAFKAAGALAEATWLVDRKWRDEADQERAMLKAIVDVHYVDNKTLHVCDLKTGNVYDSHADQLRLYAAIGLCKYPNVDEVKVSALYIDGGSVGSEATYNRSLLPNLTKYYDGRIAELEADETYIPKPDSTVCRFCPYSPKKGGPCQFAAE